MATKDHLVQRIDPWVDQRTGDLIALRRSFHEQPELAFQEQATAERVQAFLSRLGIPCRTGIAGTGIVAMLEGGQP